MELSSVEWWMILGVVCIIIEIFAVSFFFLFFGVGALLTALFSYLGLVDSLTMQLFIFATVTGLSTLAFRKQVMKAFESKGEEYQEMVNELAKVTETILPGGQGKVFFRGADWLAYSDQTAPLESGTLVKIVLVDGIKLKVALNN